jgi:hypothetical protein
MRLGADQTIRSPLLCAGRTVTKRAPFLSEHETQAKREIFRGLIVRQRLRARHGRRGKSPLGPFEPGRNTHSSSLPA